MTRIRRFWREAVRPWWYDWEWPVVGGLALLVLLLGMFGFFRLTRAAGNPVYLSDLLFQASQLFVLQVSVQSPMPWELNVARLLAPVVAAYTALQALGQILASQIQSFRLRFLHGHVVIGGAGRKGLLLARSFRELGQDVVVIEQDEENDLVHQCRDAGCVTLMGDASDPGTLRRARVSRAAHLFALCGDDGLNAEIAVRAGQLTTDRVGSPLNCVVHIVDPQLCALLHEREFDANVAGRLRLEFFNTFDLGARVLLEENPLWPAVPDEAIVPGRIVIVGVGHLGESLLVNVARQWHIHPASQRARLPISLVDKNAGQISDRILLQYPSLAKRCELTALDMEVHSAAFQQADFLRIDRLDGAPIRVFVCLDDDSLGLSAALALLRRSRDLNPTIVVRMSQNAGLAMLLRDVDTGSFRHLRAFGLLDHTCQPDQVLRGTHEILARAIHDDYLRQQSMAGTIAAPNASRVSWDALPEHLKEVYREQADAIGSKLKAVQCSAAPLLDWDEPLFQFTAEETERLSRMEHERWRAEKLKAGWRHGSTTNDHAKIHSCLVRFDELPVEQQKKERRAVQQLPGLLARVGFKVHRLAASAARQ